MGDVHPLTPERWDDLVELFGENGAVEGCWCMFWRQSGREQQQNAGKKNRRRMRGIVDEREPGVLAYDGDRPVGWCAVAPREEFGRLGRSPALKPVDDEPVWSVVCFYIPADRRGAGVGHRLLEGAVAFAVERGAKIVEGYPTDPEAGPVGNSDAYTGVVDMFERAGFREVARRRPKRPVMRYYA